MRSGFMLFTMSLVLGAACDDATEPRPRRVTLAELRFASEQVATNQAVELLAELTPGDTLAENEFVPVAILSSGGGETEARLRTRFCTFEGALIVCDQLLLTLFDGHSTSELEPLLDDLDAEFVRFKLGLPEGGTIQIFSGSLRRARERVAQHPAVRSVDVNHLRFVGGEAGTALHAAMRTSSLTRPQTSNALPTSPGDELVARYVQPDGSVLEARTRVR